MKRLYLLFIVMAALVWSGCQVGGSVPIAPGGDNDTGGPAPSPHYGTLTGSVVDDASGLKMWSGRVEIGGKTGQVQGGTFQIENIPVGTHTLRVSRTFYSDKLMQVTISSDTNVVEVRMNSIYSNADLDLFARLVHAESRGEPYRGQVAVAATVLNRVLHRNYPNTLRGVITHRHAPGSYAQYSPIDDGSINIPANQSAKNAVRDALAGWDPSLGSTGFFAPAKVPNRNNWVWQQIPVIDIGNHRFFKARTD